MILILLYFSVVFYMPARHLMLARIHTLCILDLLPLSRSLCLSRWSYGLLVGTGGEPSGWFLGNACVREDARPEARETERERESKSDEDERFMGAWEPDFGGSIPIGSKRDVAREKEKSMYLRKKKREKISPPRSLLSGAVFALQLRKDSLLLLPPPETSVCPRSSSDP